MLIYICDIMDASQVLRLLRYCYPFPNVFNCVVQASLKHEYMNYVVFGIGETALAPSKSRIGL